jgi:hypothetical protein
MESLSDDFKRCSCGEFWKTRDEFLADPNISMSGYMAHFEDLHLGLFLFQHNRDDCKTSLAIQAGEFEGLYEGETFEENLRGTDACPEYCSHKAVLEPCPAKCECAWVREVIQIVKDWPKATATGNAMPDPVY